MRQKGSASVPNVALSRFAPAALQRQAQAFPSAHLTPATAYAPAANSVAAIPGSQLPPFPGSMLGTMPIFRPASIQNTAEEIRTVPLNGNQQGILQRLAETVQPAAPSLPVDSAVRMQLPTLFPAAPPSPAVEPAAAEHSAEAAAASEIKPAERHLPESANGRLPEEAVKAEVMEPAGLQPAQQVAAPAEATAAQAGPSLALKPRAEATPTTEVKDRAEQAGPADAVNPGGSASKKWTGLREAKLLVSAINENAGLQLTGQSLIECRMCCYYKITHSRLGQYLDVRVDF